MGCSIDWQRVVKPASQRRVAVISDCENDIAAVERSLRYVGLLGKKGKLKSKVSGAHIVQAGDLLFKNAPDPAVVRFWRTLRSDAAEQGCAVHLVAGNHELEIWQRLQNGQRMGMKRQERREMRDFIRSMKLFHVEGSTLFIHGYPTVKLLRHVQAYMVRTGKELDEYNRDCFQPALDDVKLLARYGYPRRGACRGCLLYDVVNPRRYYRRNGREIAALLRWMGIEMVVHGHRPERSGVQRDREFGQLLPGIRMVSTDINLSSQGLGATLIRQLEKGPTDLVFLNRANATAEHQAMVRRLLRAPLRLLKHPSRPKATRPDPRNSGLFRVRRPRARKKVAATKSAA